MADTNRSPYDEHKTIPQWEALGLESLRLKCQALDLSESGRPIMLANRLFYHYHEDGIPPDADEIASNENVPPAEDDPPPAHDNDEVNLRHEDNDLDDEIYQLRSEAEGRDRDTLPWDDEGELLPRRSSSPESERSRLRASSSSQESDPDRDDVDSDEPPRRGRRRRRYRAVDSATPSPPPPVQIRTRRRPPVPPATRRNGTKPTARRVPDDMTSKVAELRRRNEMSSQEIKALRSHISALNSKTSAKKRRTTTTTPSVAPVAKHARLNSAVVVVKDRNKRGTLSDYYLVCQRGGGQAEEGFPPPP